MFIYTTHEFVLSCSVHCLAQCNWTSEIGLTAVNPIEEVMLSDKSAVYRVRVF